MASTSELRMGDRPFTMDARERMSGKWQVPAFVLALGTLGLSLATYRSPTSKIPFERRRDELTVLMDEGKFTAAVESGRALLSLPQLGERAKAPVHAAVARALELRAERSGGENADIARSVIEHLEHAAEGAYLLQRRDFLALGKANEWLGQDRKAVGHYEAALQLSENPDLDLRWHVARVRVDRLGDISPSMETEIDGLLAAASDRPDVLTWALEQKLNWVPDPDREKDFSSIIDAHADALNGESWRNWLEYLRGRAMALAGDTDEAELRLRALLDRLPVRDGLYARTGWMLGRVLLGSDATGRPQEAATFFHDAMSVVSEPVYMMAAELGLAESLLMLERFDEAHERFEHVLHQLKRLPPTRVVSPGVVETAMMVAGERLRQAGHLAAALRFMSSAASILANDDFKRRTLLLERLSDLQVALARRRREEADALVTDASSQKTRAALMEESRSLLLAAMETQKRIETLNVMDEERAAIAGWRAVETAHESGDAMATLAAAQRFVRIRPDNVLTSRALRYLGRAQQSMGQYEEAIKTYQANLRQFSRSPDAGNSLIPLARCFLALGLDHANQAEKTLMTILEDSPVFTPLAPEYADALFLLGEILNRTEQCERAIPVFEEAMERYPSDKRIARARFLLGDCYRQSGLALGTDAEEAVFAEEKEQLRHERTVRLTEAARMFERMVADFETRDTDGLSELEQVYLRHARLNVGDCYYELGDFDKAASRYERAAWIYKGTTTALAAYVQIINCHAFSGDRQEAAAALRRAMYLVDTIPDEAFAQREDPDTRDDWRNYFEWVERSELF